MDVQSYVSAGDLTEITVGTAVQTLAAPSAANAVRVQVTGATYPVRYTTDGSAPSTTHGNVLYAAGSAEIIALPRGATLKVTRGGGTDVVLSYQFIKMKPRFF